MKDQELANLTKSINESTQATRSLMAAIAQRDSHGEFAYGKGEGPQGKRLHKIVPPRKQSHSWFADVDNDPSINIGTVLRTSLLVQGVDIRCAYRGASVELLGLLVGFGYRNADIREDMAYFTGKTVGQTPPNWKWIPYDNRYIFTAQSAERGYGLETIYFDCRYTHVKILKTRVKSTDGTYIIDTSGYSCGTLTFWGE